MGPPLVTQQVSNLLVVHFIGRLSLETKPRPRSWPTLLIVWRQLPMGTLRCFDVDTTSISRRDVVSTLYRRRSNVVCPLGLRLLIRAGAQTQDSRSVVPLEARGLHNLYQKFYGSLCSVAARPTGLVSHRPCVTDLMVHPSTCSMDIGQGDEHPAYTLQGLGPLYLLPIHD